MLCWFKKKLYRVEVRRGDAGAYYWRILSTVNGQVIATSETYSSRDAALDTSMSVAANAGWKIEVVIE